MWAASSDERGRGTLRFSAVDASAYSPQTLPPTPPSVAAVAPDEKAAAVDSSSSSPQTLPPAETKTPLLDVLPPGGVATAVDPPLSSPQTLPPHETTPPPVTPVPPAAAAAAGSNGAKIAPLEGAEPETTNSKLDVDVDQVEAYVCGLVGSVGAIYLQQRFCVDPMPVGYFTLLLIGLALISGMAMVRLASHLKNCSSALNFRL